MDSHFWRRVLKKYYPRAISDYTQVIALAPGAAGGIASYLLGKHDQSVTDYSNTLASYCYF
ncbi:hypothetical protein [Desulfospira joergensenii]|uniref:hypothetical protein n=1 Tax=Desulfospira joergensenii TaxID=53329 RepID=UPI0003B6B6C2|nr:hypothetical protein [Desulfospira joergensenii]